MVLHVADGPIYERVEMYKPAEISKQIHTAKKPLYVTQKHIPQHGHNSILWYNIAVFWPHQTIS